MNSIKRFLAVLLTMCTLTVSVPLVLAADDSMSGKCGDHVFWFYDEKADELTISGSGRMWDFYDDEIYDLPYQSFVESTTSIRVLDGVTSIGANAFFAFQNMTQIDLPDSLKEIGDSAFVNCDALESITIPDGVTKLGNGVFFGGSWGNGLKSVVIGNGLTEIPQGTFARCFFLESVHLGNQIESIGRDAFSHCSRLKTINFPDSLVEVKEGAFYQCYSLESVALGKNLQNIDGFACSGVKELIVSNQANTIESFAFVDCYDMCRVDLGTGIQVIKEGAFSIMSYSPEEDVMLEVTIPKSVNRIEAYAFSGRSHLEMITIKNPDCVFAENAESEDNTIVGDCTTICGYTGSTAQAYAEKYGLDFVQLLDQSGSQTEEQTGNQQEGLETIDKNLFEKLIEWIRACLLQFFQAFSRQKQDISKD